MDWPTALAAESTDSSFPAGPQTAAHYHLLHSTPRSRSRSDLRHRNRRHRNRGHRNRRQHQAENRCDCRRGLIINSSACKRMPMPQPHPPTNHRPPTTRHLATAEVATTLGQKGAGEGGACLWWQPLYNYLKLKLTVERVGKIMRSASRLRTEQVAKCTGNSILK